MAIGLTRYYHCISRSVRRTYLCDERYEHRKQWIEDRLELIAECFAVSVRGFAVMDNDLHVLARLDLAEPYGWSDEDAVRQWIKVYPPKTLEGEEVEFNQSIKHGLIDYHLKDDKKVAAMRERLASFGWFMRRIKGVRNRFGDGSKVSGTVLMNDGSCSLRRRRADVFGEGCCHACGTQSQR